MIEEVAARAFEVVRPAIGAIPCAALGIVDASGNRAVMLDGIG